MKKRDVADISVPLIKPKPTTVPTSSSASIISPEDTITTEVTTIGVTASEATSSDVIVSTTEVTTFGVTASTTAATTIAVTAFTTEASIISVTAYTKEKASTTEARTVGETTSITEATTNGAAASISESKTIGETISTTKEPTITKAAPVTEVATKVKTSYATGTATTGEKASTPEATTIGETISTTEAPTIAVTTSISENTTISEETSAAEATTRVGNRTTTNTDVSSSPPTKITSVETTKNDTKFLNQTSSLPTIPTLLGSRRFCATCGNSAATAETRIVGGQEAQIGEYPWMVLLYIHFKYGSAFCGGTLIKTKWVVSAAHCFYNMNYESVDLYLGDHNIANDTEVPTTRLLAHRITIHPQYDSNTLANDISLIEISDEVTFNSRILPVCLPNVGDVVPGSFAIVTGWGTTEYGGSVSVRLQEVGVTLITNAECKTKFSGLMSILPNMLCAYETGKDACQGDSGGPLVTQLADSRWVLAGIVSFGYRCAYPNTPGVYTDVVKYVSWIEQITGSTDC